jgi:hypothetical protein
MLLGWIEGSAECLMRPDSFPPSPLFRHAYVHAPMKTISLESSRAGVAIIDVSSIGKSHPFLGNSVLDLTGAQVAKSDLA